MNGAARTPALRSHGFTLVELLVALVILAITMAMMTSSLGFSARSADAVHARVADSEELYLVYRFLQRQLAQIQPPRGDGLDGSEEPAFVADSRSLAFRGVFAAGAAVPGFSENRIAIEPDDDPGTWRLVLRGDGLSRLGGDGVAGQVLLRGLRAARWQYYVQDRRPGGRWVDRYEPSSRLPALIRLRFELVDDRSQLAHDFVFAPRIDLPVGQVVGGTH